MSLFVDFYNTLRRPNGWALATWFNLLLRYRRTFIGPLWMVARPVTFILFLGALFVGLSNFSSSVFIPHMTIGFICWTLIGGYLGRSDAVFNRNKAYLLDNNRKHTDIVILDNAELVLHFLHQCIVVVAVVIFYGTIKSPYAFMALPGLFIVIVTGALLTIILGILGARFKDVGQIIASINGVAFLATPIIWMPDLDTVPVGKRNILSAYLDYNPFYHYLELIRAPLMGNVITPYTWTFVGVGTTLCAIFAAILYKRFRHLIVFWV